MNPKKSFIGNLGQYMRKAARPLGSVDSLNPRRWRCKQLNHHGVDVCCAFVLCVAVSLAICKKVPEHNLKVLISLYYKVNRRHFLIHPGVHHTLA